MEQRAKCIVVEDDSSDDEVEILLTIHPPSPKRPLGNDIHGMYSLRNCRRRLHLGMSAHSGETSDHEENDSLDTQEDVVLADLATAKGNSSEAVGQAVSSKGENGVTGPTVERESNTTEAELNDTVACVYENSENQIVVEQDSQKPNGSCIPSATEEVSSSLKKRVARLPTRHFPCPVQPLWRKMKVKV